MKPRSFALTVSVNELLHAQDFSRCLCITFSALVVSLPAVTGCRASQDYVVSDANIRATQECTRVSSGVLVWKFTYVLRWAAREAILYHFNDRSGELQWVVIGTVPPVLCKFGGVNGG